MEVNNSQNTQVVNNTQPNKTTEESSINIMELLSKMLANWHYFVICIIIALLLFFTVSKFAIPKYEAKTTLLIKNNDNSVAQGLTGAGGNSMLNMFGNNQSNFQNAIG